MTPERADQPNREGVIHLAGIRSSYASKAVPPPQPTALIGVYEA